MQTKAKHEEKAACFPSAQEGLSVSQGVTTLADSIPALLLWMDGAML